MSILATFSQIGHMPDAGWTANGGTTNPVFSSTSNLIVLGAAYDASGGAVNVSDTFGNVWVPLTEKVSLGGGANVKARLWYAANPIVGVPHTFTFTGLNSYIQGFAIGFSGASSTPFDAESGAGNSGATSIQPGLITPAQNDEIMITVASITINALFDLITSGFSIQFNSFGIGGQRVTGGLAFKIFNVGTENPTWNWTGAVDGVSVMAAFKPPPVPPFSFGIDAKVV